MEQTQRTAKTIVRFEITEGQSFKSMLERLQKFRDCVFEFTLKAVCMNVTSAGGGMMAILNLDSIGNYYCKSPTSMGIEVGAWFRLFKKTSKEDIVVFTIDEDGLNCVCPYGTVYVFDTVRHILVEYRITMLNIDLEKHDIPEKIFPAICTVPSLELFKVLRWCTDAGTHVKVYTARVGDETKLVVETAYLDLSEVQSARVKVQMDVSVQGSDARKGVVSSPDCYKFCNLIEVARAASMLPGGDAFVYLSDGRYPLIIVYQVGTLGTMKFCIAPDNVPDEDSGSGNVDACDDDGDVHAVSSSEIVADDEPAVDHNMEDAVDADMEPDCAEYCD
jgi:hypothetical protein